MESDLKPDFVFMNSDDKINLKFCYNGDIYIKGELVGNDLWVYERIKELFKNKEYLGRLLAVMHGDGGHYQAEHGDKKAVEDAIEKFHDSWNTTQSRANFSNLSKKIYNLRDENEKLKESIYSNDDKEGKRF